MGHSGGGYNDHVGCSAGAWRNGVPRRQRAYPSLMPPVQVAPPPPVTVGTRPRGRSLSTKQALAVLAMVGGVVLLLIGFATKGFGVAGHSQQNVAGERCKAAVTKRLGLPAGATFSSPRVERGELSVLDVVDLSDGFPSLDQGTISQVWQVAGSVESTNPHGELTQHDYTCKAVFVEGRFVAATTDILNQFGAAKPA